MSWLIDIIIVLGVIQILLCKYCSKYQVFFVYVKHISKHFRKTNRLERKSM